MVRRLLTNGELVTNTANLLDISEIEVFLQAYKAHHGKEEIGAGVLTICDSLYLSYFNHPEWKIPFWVRDFCRKTLGSAYAT